MVKKFYLIKEKLKMLIKEINSLKFPSKVKKFKKLLSEIQGIKDSFIKFNDSKTNKEIFLRISQLNEIINYEHKVPFINFEVFNNKNERVFTTKDI